MQWVIRDNIPFHKLESSIFHNLMGYANQAILTAGLLPAHSTMRELIICEFNQYKEVITALLHKAPGRIHLSFNLWTSHNHLSLLSRLSFKASIIVFTNLLYRNRYSLYRHKEPALFLPSSPPPSRRATFRR